MQHNVTETVLSTFASLRVGVRRRSALGLEVLELIDESGDRAARHRNAVRAQELSWSEMDPPHPARVHVRNTGHEGVVVDVGTVIDGGLAMRAVRTRLFIRAQTQLTVAVEPLAGRWWDEGPLRRRGRLEPLATLLLLHSALSAEPLASSARTALWSLPPSQLLAPTSAISSTQLRGWLVEDEQGFVAGWMMDDSNGMRRMPPLSPHTDLCAPDAAPLRLYLALQEQVDYDELEAHTIEHEHHASRDLILLPRDSRLVDRAVAAGAQGSP